MRAIIFDLDDTLHRERCWLLSGFWSLAAHLERRHGLERRVVFRELVTAMRAGRRNGALQWLCQRLDLPEEAIPEWVQVIRMHQPRLRLAADTVRVLSILRAGWRLAVLTNGHFNKNELPPVRGFWSLTMYDHEMYMVDNPIRRYAIGDRDKLQFNQDGSLDIYIQHESPGRSKESNWLPAPSDDFDMVRAALRGSSRGVGRRRSRQR